MKCHFKIWKKNQGTAPISPHYWRVSGFLTPAYKKINLLTGYILATTLGLLLLDFHTKQKYDPKPPGPTPSHQKSVHDQQHLQIHFKNINNYMSMINPGKLILSKGSFPSRCNCSAHHFSANCSISCILNVRCLMSVSMTAEMTTSQNRRSDSQTAAVWITFTCCQAAGILHFSLPCLDTGQVQFSHWSLM